jgi:uncharacterized membrane protein YcaP (DUF421 family)
VNIDLGKILLPDTPILEIILRGTITYAALFAMLRIAKRQASSLGTPDLLVIVLIADAAQNAMAGQYTSVGDGILLVGTIVFWAYALDWLGYHLPAVERILHPPPLPLIEDGRTLPRNLKAELLTTEELMSALRSQGVDDIAAVERAYLEGNGQLTVIQKSDHAKG